MADLDLKMSIKAEDQASRALAQVSQAVKKTGQVAEQAARTTSSATQRMAQTRANLGIRSEKEIQREIQRTIASYNRLARSGTASARDIARAQEAARNKVRELNAEMGKTSTGQRLANAGRNVMGAVAGVTAGAMVMREPVRKSLGYDRELAMVANTAFSDRNAEGRIAGKKELHEAVKNAVATSGGTKEEALASINALLASGMDAKTAMNLLPTLQKGAVATGASAEELSAIAISALQNGIAEADIGKALDMAVAAGQAGQFELRDMAKWLPQQMAKASAMGLSGLEGFQTLLVANQQSRVTAGTNDEAGNNLSNLLGKITAKETADRFSKIAYKDEKGKVREINYLKSMEAYKAQGKNSLEAFMAILDKVVGNNDDYKALQEKLKRANGKEEQAKLLAEMAKLIEGSAIAEIVSDQQALMALLGIRNNVQLGKTVNEQVENSQGAVDTSHKVIAETNDFKIDKAKSLAEFGQMEGLQGFNNLLGSASETLTDYMTKYPDLTAAVAGAGTGIAALGAAAFAAAGSISLLGGGKGGGLGDLLGSSRGKTPMASGGKLGTALKWGSRAVGVVGVATMLSGDESEETKRLKAQHSTARYAVEKGTANAEQEKLVYEQSKASVDKYDQGGWFTRLMMSESGVAKSRQYMADYEAKQAVKSAPNVANGIAQFTSQIGTLATQQATTKGQVDSVSQVLSQYQADFAAFGQVISDGLQAGLTSQSHTIDNRITVELDGSVIAEKVSQHQFQFFKRG